MLRERERGGLKEFPRSPAPAALSPPHAPPAREASPVSAAPAGSRAAAPGPRALAGSTAALSAAARAYPAEPGRECVPISTAVCVVAQAAPDGDGGGADPGARVDAPTARPVLTARPC